ncbi:MAG: helix-turn-helix domain-containing protein [Microcoleus sp.]
MARRKQSQNRENMPALQILMEQAGLNQTALARQIPDKTGTKTLSQSAISRWLSGEDSPELTIRQVKALCRALGKKLEELPDDLGPVNQQMDKNHSKTSHS